MLAAMRVSPVPLMRGFGTVYVNIFRNIPLTVIISCMLAGASPNQLGVRLAPRGVDRGLPGRPELPAGRARASSSTPRPSSARRSGPASTPCRPGQAEAARAIGLTFTQMLGIIVLPQAFRAVIAPLARC